jgi:hypothetical protein
MENYTENNGVFRRVDGAIIDLTNIDRGLGAQTYERQDNGHIYVCTGHANLIVEEEEQAVFFLDREADNLICDAGELGDNFIACNRAATYVIHGFEFFIGQNQIAIPNNIDLNELTQQQRLAVTDFNRFLDIVRRSYFDHIAINRRPTEIYFGTGMWQELENMMRRVTQHQGNFNGLRVTYKGNIPVRESNDPHLQPNGFVFNH